MNALNVLAYFYNSGDDGLIVGGVLLCAAAALWNWIRDRWTG